MKNIQLIILLIVGLSSILFLVKKNIILESKYSVLNSKVEILLNDSIPETSIQKAELEYQFKENYYMENLNRESNYIILYVSILFGILGLVGFTLFGKSIEIETNKIETNLNSSLSEFGERISTIENKSNSNKSRLNITTANTFSLIADEVKKDIGKRILYNLSAAHYFYKAIENCQNQQAVTLEKMAKKHLEDCLKKCDKIKDKEINDLIEKKTEIEKIMKDLFKCDNKEILSSLSRIRTFLDEKYAG